jgi:hypothetical protein
MRISRKLPAALAAVLFGIGLATAGPAHAADEPIQTGLGMNCGGTNVVRCAWVNFDPNLHRVRPYGLVAEQVAGAQTVAISVGIQIRPAGLNTWDHPDVRTYSNDIVYGTTSIERAGTAFHCNTRHDYRAYVQWAGPGGNGSVYSGTFHNNVGCEP